ncbi:MAG: 5-histidylcysteine sulfoxide synthase, partial [Trichodesmium sp. St4_bin8_1]|nr:5-histidylcysteine sulfoxide synthase [Trichodesmium sp. St4_bin8_1]
MNSIKSTTPPKLDSCHADLDFRQYILEYFKNAWEIEDLLMHSLVGEETFYSKPDPLRNPLIFYLGHTAVFYINKLVF